MYDAVTSVSAKPLLLAEVASTEIGGSKADGITNALNSQLAHHYPRVRAFVWFDVNKEQAWNLDSSPASLHAWFEATRGPLFGANVDVLARS
jgi:mannan endo-1,4-beta-mannosidase